MSRVRNIGAIFAREVAAYFLSPTAYVVLFFFMITNGVTFYVYTKSFQLDPRQIDRVVQFLFGFAPFWILFLLMPPILTMRLFSEEKRSGSIEMLMTAPVTSAQAVLGKFFASTFFLALIWSTILALVAILEVLGDIDWGTILAFYVGLICLGGFFSAVGVLASSLTQNQLIAAIIAISVNLGLFFVQQCRGLFPEDPDAQKFFDFVSFHHHFYNDYSRGLVDVRYIALYLGFTVFTLFFAVKILEGRRAGRSIWRTANFVAVVFLSLYILVVGNIIAYRHPHRVDLTSERLHTLTEETEKRLDLLEDDVNVVVPFLFSSVAQVHQQIFRRSREILDQFIAIQPKIRIEAELNLQSQGDSNEWLKIREKYKLTESQLNSFIFVNAADSSLMQVVPVRELASFETDPPKIHRIVAEEAFREALTRLLRRERKTIYFTRDHGELSTMDQGRGGISRLRQELEANGADVKEIRLLTSPSIPADCDLLVIMSPSKVFKESDQAKIHDYLSAGGRVWVAAGVATRGLEPVLEEWGVSLGHGRVEQKQKVLGGMQQWVGTVTGEAVNDSHPITRALSKAANFELVGQDVRPLDVSFNKQSVFGEYLFQTPEARIDGGDVQTNVVWAGAIRMRRPDRPPPRYVHVPTRMVVYGAASPFTNFWLDRFSHRDVALNTARWLLGEEATLSTGGQIWRERRISWSDKIDAFLFWVPIFLFPGIVLCFGTFVFFLRRQ